MSNPAITAASSPSSSRSREFWARKKVSFDEIPTYQDLLCVCDHGLLQEVLLGEFLEQRNPFDHMQKKTIAESRLLIQAALDVMCTAESPEGKGDYLFLPLSSFKRDSLTGRTRCRIEAALVRTGDEANVKKALCVLESKTKDYEQVIEAYDYLATAKLDIMGPNDYSQANWDDLLFSRIWIKHSLCLRERYLMLASVFWEMTRHHLKRNTQRRQVCKMAEYEDDEWPADPYGLLDPRGFEQDLERKISQSLAIANHNAFLTLLSDYLDVSRRLSPEVA